MTPFLWTTSGASDVEVDTCPEFRPLDCGPWQGFPYLKHEPQWMPFVLHFSRGMLSKNSLKGIVLGDLSLK